MIACCVRHFLLISGFCMLLNNAVLIIMDRAGASLGVSVLLSFTACVAAGYALQSRFSLRRPLEFASFARYALAMSINIPLAFVTLWMWRDLAGWRIEVAAPSATVTTTSINFMLCRFFVFSQREAAKFVVHP